MNPEEIKALLKQASADKARIFLKQSAPIETEKIDLANRRVTVQSMTAVEPDLHLHRMTAETIREAQISYMAEWQVTGRMHKTVTNSYPVQAWQDDFGNAWFTYQVVDEEDWQAITNGTYSGMSWGGWAYAAELPDGTFLLSDVVMAENSFVDRPAVPEATFKAEDGAADEGTLLAQLASGKVKPRVASGGKKPGPMKSWTDKVLTGFLSLMHSNDPTDVGGENNPEDDDMKPEQEAKIDALIGKVDSLAAEVEGLKGQAAPAEQQEAEAKAKADAEAAAKVGDDKGLTSADITSAVTAAVEAAVKPLQDKIEDQAKQLSELGKRPAGSMRLTGDEDSGEETKKFEPARCSQPR